MEKRERGANFSESEKQILFSIFGQYFHVLENKKTDAISIKEKKNIWTLLANRFNSVSGSVPRTAIQLKNAYRNFKKKLKKDIADNKVELFKTGGGPVVKQKVNKEKAKLISLLIPHLQPMIPNYNSSANNIMQDDFIVDEKMTILNLPVTSEISEDPLNLTPTESGYSPSNTNNIEFETYPPNDIQNKQKSSDVNDEEVSGYSLEKFMAVHHKAKLELDILMLKLEREKEERELNKLKCEIEQVRLLQEKEKLLQEKEKTKQEEEQTKQEKEKTKQEIIKTKNMEMGEV